MTASERLKDILKQVEQQGTVQVKTLAILYRVTEDLIRKDLKKLEQQGAIDRVYGGAERKKNKFERSSIHFRMHYNESEKSTIADRAVAYIQPGDYVFLDTSSTCAYIAKALAHAGKEVTVVTDMLEIVNILSPCEEVTVIAIGGVYNRYTGGFSGQEAIRQIEQYSVDKAFISCRSVSLEEGVLIEGFVDIGNAKRTILNIAREKIVATQSIKYKSSGVYKFYNLEGINAVISEAPFDAHQLQKLNHYKVKVIEG